MNLPLLLNLVSTLALVCGLLFASLQFRDARRSQLRAARLELVRSFQSPEFVRALGLVISLPDGLSRRELYERLDGPQRDLLHLVLATWESIGVLLYRGDLSLELVSDFFGGVIPICWAKLSGLVADLREEHGEERVGEWFELAAMRLKERERVRPRLPAHRAEPAPARAELRP
ncbi:DUF4760 domain-containing protein [Longimicrobium sp.]|uniref:DUF4760 domain-containing protein n=1 Tax=Longimicrobium sp. TaxID=2029185 RepID=UPI002CAC377D|nr:hypothetical protein [Longimicrobium sp.]HSU15437.1 hypothetical protein [Longimicrobium sp.]